MLSEPSLQAWCLSFSFSQTTSIVTQFKSAHHYLRMLVRLRWWCSMLIVHVCTFSAGCVMYALERVTAFCLLFLHVSAAVCCVCRNSRIWGFQAILSFWEVHWWFLPQNNVIFPLCFTQIRFEFRWPKSLSRLWVQQQRPVFFAAEEISQFQTWEKITALQFTTQCRCRLPTV